MQELEKYKINLKTMANVLIEFIKWDLIKLRFIKFRFQYLLIIYKLHAVKLIIISRVWWLKCIGLP